MNKTIIKAAIFVVIALLLVFSSGSMFEKNDADTILVVQGAIDGKLAFYTDAGIKPQWWGKAIKYPKRDLYKFEVPVRFNDGGHGTMIGSIQYEMPLDDSNLTEIHTKFGNADAVQKSLIETIVNKCIYMTGPLMSSKESYNEKRNYLIHFVDDQIKNGVYRTTQRETKTVDAMTGTEKTVAIVEINMKDGLPERQEEAVLSKYGIRPFNFSIERLPYDQHVETQIQEQQKLTMEVATSIAEAKKAEQRAITVEKEGQANAAQSKWEQEVIKAKMVTEAEQKLEVARLEAETAAQYKIKLALEAEADANYKRKMMEADGALQQKLDAYMMVNEKYANAIAAYQGSWVPTTVMGSDGTKQVDGAQALINLLMVKTANDLSLDMGMMGKKK